jgi:drug/metabolite transporter (DMT)-like permease
LRALKLVDASFPERVLKIAEAHAGADVRKKDRDSLSDFITPIIAQIITLLICCMGFGIGALFAFKGVKAVAIASVVVGIAPIIIAALSNLRRK